MVTFVDGDLLDLRGVDAFAHQVNCLCVKPHGLSKQIADKYPWADIYSKRRSEGQRNLAVVEDRGVPGTIKIFKSPTSQSPDVVCFLSQWDFGSTEQSWRRIPPHEDTTENRLVWFRQCFQQLRTVDIKTLGLPYRMGCGLAGGDWTLYFKVINDFAEQSGMKIIIVKPRMSLKKKVNVAI